ncbi:MAG: HesA/MoeB/ThiF family protein, partial [Burkholderiaceae bacterium]
MDDTQLLRYSRHILLDDLGIEGQEALLAARVLMVGAGGLGSSAGLFLGSAGVGQLTVVDHDTVDATNLQRQIAHNLARVGMPKAESMHEAIAAINPDVTVRTVTRRADDALLNELVAQADVVLDCTDNFATRHAINQACFSAGKPLVSGAAIRMDGQLSVYDPRDAASPCYACVFPQTEAVEETRCATMGVFAPL